MNRWSVQKDRYKACVQGPLEDKIVAVTFDSPQIRYAREKGGTTEETKLWNALLQWIADWRHLLANRSNQQVTSEQLDQEVIFLIRYFSLFTLADLQWSKELYILRQLPIEYPEIVVFNPDFLSRVLTGYQRYKRERGSRLAKEVQQRRQMRATGTPEQNADGMRYMIEEVHRQLEGGALVVHMLQDVYSYLRRIGLLSADMVLDEKGQAYVMQRLKLLSDQQAKKRDTLSIKELVNGVVLTSSERDKVAGRVATEWAVKQVFSRFTLQQVLEKVKVKHFEREKTDKDVL